MNDLSEVLRASALLPIPRVCAPSPGTGGTLKNEPEDFEVEEVPAYTPSGSGDHLYLWLEKTDLPAMQLTSFVARALHVDPRDIGCAGLKDARAVTRQYLSVPKTAEPHLAALEGHPKVRLLHAAAHGNKLKTGHLRGNKFRIRVRDVQEGAHLQAQQMLQFLASTGLPNAYGLQRFGYQGHTAILGAEVLELVPRGGGRLGRNTLRLALSALQSVVFNACLRERMARGLYATPLLGDVMQVRASGGPFVVDDPERELERLTNHEIVLTGPMPGPKMRAAEHLGLALETDVLRGLQLGWEHFSKPHKLMQGTRRPLTVWPEDVAAQACSHTADGHNMVVNFTLPKGAFATCVMHELMGYGADGVATAAPLASA